MGSVTLQAAATGLGSGALSVTVQPAAVSQIVLSGATTVTAGVCSAFTMTAKDAYGNTNSVSSAVTVTLSNSGSGQFYSDSGCTTSNTNFTISTTVKTFYFKDSQSEPITISSANNGSLTSGTLPVTINSAPVTRLALSGSTTPTAGTCTAYTVTAEDSFGNSTNVGLSTVVALSANGSGAFYSDSGCSTSVTSVAITVSSQTFYFKDTLAETVTLSASYTGLTTGTLNVAVSDNVPNTLVLSGSLVSVQEVAPSMPLLLKIFTGTPLR